MNKFHIFLLCLFLPLTGCNDFLEVTSKSQISDDILWENPDNADLFLNNVYAGLTGPFNTDDPNENWTDNAMVSRVGPTSRSLIALSQYAPNNAPSQWGNYNNIRRANVFIEKVNQYTFPDTWKKQRLAEARFLRAYYHMLLWTAYGGVPVITDILNMTEQGEAVFRARNSQEETFRFITDECEAIAADLPPTSNAGRATRGAALTLKGWCELFWASPLNNPQNLPARWEAAANTYKRVADLKVYQLFPDYNALHFEANNNNSEVIFDKQYIGGTNLGGSREGLQGPWVVNGSQRAWGGVNPTQELVDEYAMANGLPITDPQSGYDPQNPYRNRESRFYQSVIYDGAEWLGFPMSIRQGSRIATDLSDANEATNTGYYLRKGLNPIYAINGNHLQNSASFIIFRYAEVLLGYAEARNEATGPDGSVYEAINLVRARVSLPGLKEGLNKDDMRVAIHRERRVELAFEEKRWYDLIRLKLAEKNLNGSLHAVVIEEQGGVPKYRIISAPGGARAFFKEKNYFLPLPQSAIDRNQKLTQNPNY